MKCSLICVVLVFALLPLKSIAADTTHAGGGLSAESILKEVEKRINSQDESARIVMTIGEANGATKVREIEIRRKSNDPAKVLVKLQSPADLRGTALLSIGGKGQEDQWLYLPSSKHTRRILSSNKSSSFMGSEMSYEDMGSSSDKKFESKTLRNESSPQGPVTVIESKVISGNSAYSKILTWVTTSNYLVNKVEYYDPKGALLKVTEMSDYKQFKGNIWRAQNIMIKNVQNHRTTQLALKDLSINLGLEDEEFTLTAMAE